MLLRAEAFLREHRDRPFFLYYHTMELHAPYHVGDDYKQFGDASDLSPKAAYDRTIRRADDNLARFVGTVEDLGLAKGTLIVLVADHGEAFGEHDGFYKHVGKPYNDQIHVPLIFYLPGTIRPGDVIDTNVQLTDLAPTLLELAGLAGAEHMTGQSLMPFLKDGMSPLPEDRPIFSFGSETISVIQDNWKLMIDRGSGDIQLFNIDTDYHETVDHAGEEPAIADKLRQEWEKASSRHQNLARSLGVGKTRTMAVDADREEALEALGYLE